MDTFTFTKRDFFCFLAVCALLPLASFIAGVLISEPSGTSATPPHYVDASAPVKESCAVESQVRPERDVKQLVILDRTAPELGSREIVDSGAKIKPQVMPVRDVQYYVQAGAFSKAKNAEKFVDALARKGIDAEVITTESQDSAYFRVVIGAFDSEAKAKAQLSRVESRHSIELYVTRETTPPAYLAGL